jgi:hypothetical protein
VRSPLTAPGCVCALSRGSAADAPGWGDLTSGAFLRRASLIHLWFLDDLLLLYAAALAVSPLLRRAPDRLRRAVGAGFGRLVTSAWGPLACSGVTALTLLPMSVAGLDTSTAFTPPPRIVIAYGVFFAFGWLLYARRDRLQALGRRCRWHLPAGVAGSAVSLVHFQVTLSGMWYTKIYAHSTLDPTAHGGRAGYARSRPPLGRGLYSPPLSDTAGQCRGPAQHYHCAPPVVL